MECRNVDRVGVPIASSALNHDRNEGCCSVAPQKSRAIVPDKFKADSVVPDVIFLGSILRLHPSRDLTSSVPGVTCPTQDLPVVLRTFRI